MEDELAVLGLWAKRCVQAELTSIQLQGLLITPVYINLKPFRIHPNFLPVLSQSHPRQIPGCIWVGDVPLPELNRSRSLPTSPNWTRHSPLTFMYLPFSGNLSSLFGRRLIFELKGKKSFRGKSPDEMLPSAHLYVWDCSYNFSFSFYSKWKNEGDGKVERKIEREENDINYFRWRKICFSLDSSPLTVACTSTSIIIPIYTTEYIHITFNIYSLSLYSPAALHSIPSPWYLRKVFQFFSLFSSHHWINK